MPEESPFASRSDERLLRDLCVALDTVARHEGKAGLQTFIEDVRVIHAELARRGVDWSQELDAYPEVRGRPWGVLWKNALGTPHKGLMRSIRHWKYR